MRDDMMSLLKAHRITVLPFLLTLLLLLPQITAQASFAWYCEGRVCGVIARQCCCEAQNSNERDSLCAITRRSTPEAGTSRYCAAFCNCKMVWQAADSQNAVSHDVSATISVFPPIANLAPVPFESAFCLVKPTAVYFIESRGPPAASYLAPALSLRAPPRA